MRTALIPGSFDPVTEGHMDIIRRTAMIFERVIVAVMDNSSKSCAFSPDERVDMLRRSVEADGLSNVEIIRDGGLLADLAGRYEAVVVKGLRSSTDYTYEQPMAVINKRLNPTCETFFLCSDEKHAAVSSSIVRTISSMGGDITGFVPSAVKDDINRKLNKEAKNGHGY